MCLLVTNDLLPVRVPCPTPAETVWVDLLQYKPPLRLGVCYLPYVSADSVGLLLAALDSAAPVESNQPLLIVGDFNLRHVDWSAFVPTPSEPQPSLSKSLLDAWSLRGLTQLVRTPTHERGAILDLVLVSDPFLVQSTAVGPLFSDHRSIQCSLAPCAPVSSRRKWLDWKSADFASMAVELDTVDWEMEFSYCANVDHAWEAIETKLTHLKQAHVKVRSAHPSYPFTNHPRTRGLIRRKSRLTSAIAEEVDPLKKNILIERRDLLSDELSDIIREIDREKQHTVAAARNTAEGTKRFFAFARQKTKLKRGIPPLKSPSGGQVNQSLGKAELLNETFCAAFSVDNGHLPPFPCRSADVLSSVVIEDEDVFVKLHQLPLKTSHGPDGLPQLMLKMLSHQLAHPLAWLFRLCLATGRVPSQWKSAIIAPIFKAGDPSAPANYRPISLTSATCRLFETFLKEAIEDHLEKNHLISKDQHGFRKSRSTVTQLLQATNDWTLALESGQPTDVIYTSI